MAERQQQDRRAEMVAHNAKGYRVGETHHRARVPDSVVVVLREMHAVGFPCAELARMFGLRRGTVAKYLRGQLRAQAVASWRPAKRP